MIDLHCHLLPGIDDGARNLDDALAMARMAVADGITQVACTPHVYPGVYNNDGPQILAAVAALTRELQVAGITLPLTYGGDVHLTGDLVPGLKTGNVPTLAGSRYFLLEFPDRVPWRVMCDAAFLLIRNGYVPVITHPERQQWIEEGFARLPELLRQGVWLQVTAGSLTGRFGRDARYWGERLVAAGWVHLLATDAHNVRRRPPALAEGRAVAAAWLGEAEADRMVRSRPGGIVADDAPANIPPPPGLTGGGPLQLPSWRRWSLLLRSWRALRG